MTKVFAVFKEGVYRHECGGVFEAEDAARERADALAREDQDDYHTYEVVPFDLGVPVKMEDEPIYKTRKPPTNSA